MDASAGPLNQVAENIIHAAIKIHRALGPGLRLSKCRVGLILNFNKDALVSGVKRVVNDFPEGRTSSATVTS